MTEPTRTRLSEMLRRKVAELEPGHAENERVRARVRGLKEALMRSDARIEQFVPVGSWARGAKIASIDRVGALVIYRGSAPATPGEALQWLANAAGECLPDATTEIVEQGVRITDTDSFVFNLYAEFPDDKHPETLREARIDQWGQVRTPEQQEAMFRAADQRAGRLLRELLLLAQAWSRNHGNKLSYTHLYAMALHAFFETPPGDLATGLRSLFVHLASAVLEPCPDPYGIDETRGEDVEVPVRERLSMLMRAASERLQRAIELEQERLQQEALRIVQGLFGDEPDPGSTAPVVRIDLELDVQQGLPLAELPAITGLAPENIAERHLIRLSECVKGLALSADGSALSADAWEALAQGVVDMVARAGEARDQAHAAQQTVIFVIYGRAPLPVFVHLGMALSSWAGRQLFLNRRPDGAWDVLSPHDPIDPDAPRFFDAVTGVTRAAPLHSRGRVAVFVSPAGYAAPMAAMQAFFAKHGETMASLVEIRSNRNQWLDASNAASAAQELIDHFRGIRAAYPEAEGISLFVAGPAPLAFLAGRAVNPNVLGTVRVPNYRAPDYVDTVLLPWRGTPGAERAHEARLVLDRLATQGFRGLGALEITFAPGFTVLIGKNGSGKTSVLDALAIMLARLFAPLTGKSKAFPIDVDDIQNNTARLRMTLHGLLEGEAVEWTVERSRSHKRTAMNLPRNLRSRIDAFGERLEQDTENLPFAVYYSVNRATLDIPARTSKQKGELTARLYEHALVKGEADFRAFFNWFKEREDDENAERRTNLAYEDRKLRAVRRAVESMLDGFRNLRIERKPLRMVITKDIADLSMQQLSDGERSLIALVGDLARRLCDANPALVDPLLGSAVVLIDELELHLHPAWQRTLVQKLERTFPKCQFVATTHSPQILGHVQADSVRLLRARPEGGVAVVRARGAYGLDANLILEELMGVPAQPEEIQEEIKAIYQLIEDGALDQAEQRKARLAHEMGATYPEFVRMDMYLRRARRRAP